MPVVVSEWSVPDSLIPSLANGAGVSGSVAETKSSFTDFLVKSGVAPAEAGKAADALVHRIVDALAHGASPEAAIATARTDIGGVIDHLVEAAQNEGPPGLDVALAQGNPKALAQAAHDLGVDHLPAEAQKAAITAWQSALANGADPAQAREAALDKAQGMVKAMADSNVELGHGDALAAHLASGGAEAAAAIQAMTAGLPAAQATAMVNSLTAALASGASPAQALATAGAAAGSARATGDSQGVPMSQADTLVAALAGSGGDIHGALAAAGLSGSGIDAFLQALASNSSSEGALAAAQAAQQAAQHAAAQASAGVQGSALAAALATGGSEAAAALSGMGGSGAGRDAFMNALSQALASGASLDQAVQSADSSASQASAAETAAATSSSSLVAALASGQNVQSALTAAGVGSSESGQAFAAALSSALASGSPVEAAVHQASSAASAAESQLASSNAPTDNAATGPSTSSLAQGPTGDQATTTPVTPAPATGPTASTSPTTPAASPPPATNPTTQTADNSPPVPQTPTVPDLPAVTPTPPPAALVTASQSSSTASPPSPTIVAPHTLTLTAPAALTYTDTAALDSFANQTGTLSATDSQGDPVSYGLSGATAGSYTIGGVAYTASEAGSYGTLYLNTASGAYVYVPTSNATINDLGPGSYSDSFLFTAAAGGLSASASLIINITGVYDTPIVSAPTALSYTDTTAADSFSSQTGTLSATDAEGSTMTYGISSSSSGSYTTGGITYDLSKAGSYGTLWIKSATGAYIYVPSNTAINDLGPGSYSDSFTLTAAANGLTGSNTLTVNITGVYDTPVWTANPATMTFYDTAAVDTASSLVAAMSGSATGTLSVTDPEGSTLTYSISGESSASYQPASILYDKSVTGSYGTLYLKSTTGAYDYVPNATAINALSPGSYTDTFTLSAAANGLSASDTLTVDVTGVYDTPVVATPTTLSYTDSSSVSTFSNQTGSVSATDAESGTMTYGISGGSSGSYTYNGVTYDISDTGSYGTLWIDSSGTYAGDYVYVPSATAIKALTATTASDSFTLDAYAHSLTGTNTLTVDVTGVNEAPTITSGASYTLTATAITASASTPTLVSTILSGAGWADVDTGALEGMAITAASGNGTWKYSTDGTNWTAFGTVGSTAALLLSPTTEIEYVPSGSYNETASFSYRAWDETSGTASSYGSPSTASTASNGASTAFSTNTASASLNIIDGIPAVNETFTSESQLGISWTVGGNASSIPDSTNGVILTTDDYSQAGYVINNIPFQVQTGIDVTFTYNMPGGTGTSAADGISFFLINGTTALDDTFNIGAYGGGLGYQGITNGILGVGFDEYGNFAGHVDSIAMYGPTVDGSNTKLTDISGSSSYVSVGSGLVLGAHTVEITLVYNSANSDYDITVKLDGATKISNYELTTLGITNASTLMFGFAGSTGGSKDLHSIESVVVTADPPLPAVAENTLNPQGETIASLFAASDPAQVAITADRATSDQGSWQYSTDGGSDWTTLPAGDSGNTVLNPSDLLRFLPTENWSGSPGTLTAGLIDTPGGSVVGNDVVSTIVTATDVAPVASGSATLATVAENASNPTGSTVADLFAPTYSDGADALPGTSLAAIAVVGNLADASQGSWQYSTDQGTSWTGIGSTPSDTSALVLAASDELRFLPGQDYTGTPGALSARLIESGGTVPTDGSVIDLSAAGATGGGSDVSAATVALSTTVTPGPAFAADNALALDGSTNVTVANTAALDPTSGLTLEAWVQLGAAGGSIIDNLSANGGYKLAVDSGGNLQLTIGNGSSTTTLTSSCVNLADGGWHDVAATYDGGALHLYVDNSDVADLSGVSPTALGASSFANLILGDGLDGALNDVRIWSDAHSQSQIAAETSHSLTGGENGLAGYWSFDAANGDSFANLVTGAGYGSATVSATPTLLDLFNPTAGATIQVATNAASYKGMILGTDADGSQDSYSIADNGGPAHGTVNFTNNAFVYTPTSGHITQNDSFTVAVSDGGHTVDHQITIHPA